MQDALVALIVAACTVYAAWSLMPAAWRRGLAGRLVGAPLPGWLRARFGRLARSAPGCGCDGCDGPAAKAPASGGTQPVHFVRKRSG